MRRKDRASLELLKGKTNLKGIEIGVQTGVNAKWMLENLDIEKLYLIDPYTEYRCNNKKAPEDGGTHPATPELKESCKALLKPWENKIEYIYKYSWGAISMFDPRSLDFVYVDGDHREDVILEDLEYIDKIKLGGMLCGHDWRFKSIKAALKRFVEERSYKLNCCKTKQLVQTVWYHSGGSDWWIHVPEGNQTKKYGCKLCQKVYSINVGELQDV